MGCPGSGVAPDLLPAVQWNIVAWLAWAVLVVGLRYVAERRRQATEREAAAQALEVTFIGREHGAHIRLVRRFSLRSKTQFSDGP
jgi:hypothetical protein